jgi:hypothetical protein
MKSPTKALLPAGLGAVAMYYLDPAQGRKRRDLARDRIEYGRDRLEKASHTARVVGHDVSERADGAFARARAVGHDVGERAGRLTHGLKSVGRDTGHRAAGAVSSLGSLFNGRPARRAPRESAWKFLGVPVMWVFIAGIGASVMYLFDPSQGIYRRARLRQRLPSQGTRGQSDGATGEAANDTNSAEPAQATARQRAADASRLGNQERPLSS